MNDTIRAFGLGSALLLAAGAQPAFAQPSACPPPPDLSVNNPLNTIVSAGGRLKGLVLLRDAFEWFQTSVNGQGTAQCAAQLLRFYQNQPVPPNQNPDLVRVPQPGPTLRAKVGDMVQLTFVNQIDTADYGASIDRAENTNGCDKSSAGYPTLVPANGSTPAIIDTLPNCFHGSSTGNIHFHGTHTSPTSTGDDVFIGVRPSPRVKGQPTITPTTFAAEYDRFFRDCELRIRNPNIPVQWPRTWADMPPTWTAAQQKLLQAYDVGKPADQQLWPVDAQQIAAKQWPQYYVGSFPQCFYLPKGPDTVPPLTTPGFHMGQAPGTHWYHAHKHGSTALNVSNGMAGAFIIEGETYDGQFNKLYGPGWTRRQPVLVVNQLGTTPALERGATAPGAGQGPFSVNGVQQATMTMAPGQVMLWRIVNASSGSGFYLPALPPGFSWRQTAQDGVQFNNNNYQTRAQRPVFVAAGNRIDLLVQAPATPVTTPLLVTQANSIAAAAGGAPAPLFTIKVAGKPVQGPGLPATAPKPPGFLADIQPGEVTNKRELVFESTGGGGSRQHTINGAKFQEGNPVQIKNVNVVEEWTVSNKTVRPGKLDHPFHIHINPFQVTEVFNPNAPLVNAQGQVLNTSGQPWLNPNGTTNGAAATLYAVAPGTTPPKLQNGQCWLNPDDQTTWKPCPGLGPTSTTTNIWWDVFPIPAAIAPKKSDGSTVTIAGYFKMRSRFVDYAGSYVLHCHILAHEDRGMMMMVDVGPAPAVAYQHH